MKLHSHKLLLSKILCLLLFILGTLLPGLNILGLIILPIEDNLATRTPVAGYSTRGISPTEALRKISELTPQNAEEKARSLFDLLANSYIHAPSYILQPWDNWFMWLRSLQSKSFRESSQDINTLWKRGGGFCRQAAQIYAGKAQELGLEARIILLSGHVVAEVLIPDKGWKVVDPDLDIFWDNPIEDFGSTVPTEIIIEKVVARGFSREYAQQVASLYTSQSDNFKRPFPLDEVRYQFEMTSKYSSWGVPIALIALALLLAYSRITGASCNRSRGYK